MPVRDPNSCRRALREISEIAAVATLQGSQMSDHDALQAIAAIAAWVMEDAPSKGADCGKVVRQLNAMTGAVDLDALDDQEAVALFGDVLKTLKMSAMVAAPSDPSANPQRQAQA